MKLKRCEYNSVEDFDMDIKKIFKNSYNYNGKNSFMHEVTVSF